MSGYESNTQTWWLFDKHGKCPRCERSTVVNVDGICKKCFNKAKAEGK